MAQQKAQGTITIIDTTDINSIKNWYLATNASSGVDKTTTGWTDTIQQMSASKQYLWNYEQILGSGNVEISSTQPVIIGHYGINGQNGADGNSIVSITEYYQVTDSTTNPGASGWQTTLVVPTNVNKYLWNYQVINYSKTAAEGSYSDARIIGVYGDKGETGDTGPQGPQGNAGINTATVYLYQRATSAPAKPSGNLTYTFASSSITSGTLGNWKQSIGELIGTNPIWVIAAVASSNGATDVIASSEWSTQIKLAQDGTNGTNGTNGTDGLNQATVFIYIRASSAVTPSPATTTYTFSTGGFTAPTNWSKTIPASNGNPCYVSSAVAIGNGATATLTWNTPSILVEDGSDGISPTVTSTTNGVKIVDANGNETYITNGTNGQSYYTYVRYSSKLSPTSATDVSSSPTGKSYIGIQTTTSSSAPAWDDSNWNWTKYIGTDGTNGTNGTNGTDGVSVTGVRELYYLKTNSTNPSTITSSSQITATDRQNGWTSIVPTFVNNGVYYTCIETSLSSGGPVWSAPVENKGLTSSNQNALNAYNTSTARDTEINALQAQAKHYWWDNQGAHVAAGENTTDVNNITQGTPSTYGFNSLMAPGYLALKYKDINFAQLATNSLTFYRPATNGSTYVQGKKGMDLTADALTFYKPLAYNSANEPTAAATLNANGLVLSEGGLEAGTKNTTDYIYLYSKDEATNHTININSSGNKSDWRIVAGNKFGVDKAGNLYASNATISGAINATSLTLEPGVTISTNDISGLSTVATSGSYNDLDNKPTIPSLTGYIHTDGTIGSTAAEGANSFTVASSGALTASNAIIYGTLYASKGYIGGWQIGTDGNKSLHNGNSNTSPTIGSGTIILSKGLASTTSIAGSSGSQTWTIAAGTNFGVTTAGKLYATGAEISGDLTASSLKINGTNYLTDITTISSKASGNAEYEVVIKVNSIDYINSSATLIAIPTKLGESTTGSFVWYKNAINTAHGGTVSTTTNTNDTLIVSDLEALYIAVLQ